MWSDSAVVDAGFTPAGLSPAAARQLVELPDGEAAVMIGDVLRDAAFNHLQGDNPEHDAGDCGVVCCAEVLNQFGRAATETSLVAHATACRELHVVAGHPGESGWTLPAEQAAILADYGVPARAESARTTEWLAAAVQGGHGVIAMVNAGVLWSDPRALGHGQANHAVTVTGVALDPDDEALLGFYVNDSGSGESGRYVPAHLIRTAFERTGGFCVVTDAALPSQPEPVDDEIRHADDGAELGGKQPQRLG